MTPKHAPSSHLWLVLLVALLAAIASTAVPAAAAPKWTVMVYVDADNDLEHYGIVDVNQMEWMPPTIPTSVNVVVQMDRIGGYDTSNSDWTTAHRFPIVYDDTLDLEDIVSDPSADPWLTDIGEVDMASPDTLYEFVKWTKDHYPADHYALIIWDHGNGWRKGTIATKAVCADDTSGTIMTLEDLQMGLSRATGYLGKKLDVLAFDACEMSTMEVAYAVRNYADYFVGSEADVPALGMDYADMLTQLSRFPTVDGKGFAVDMVRSYYYSYLGGSQYDPADNIPVYADVQMVALDLSKMDAATSSLTAFADAMIAEQAANPNGIIGPEVHTWWEVAKIPDPSFYDDEIDLGRFVNIAAGTASPPAVKTAASNLLSALWGTSGLTVANMSSLPPYGTYTGMTIYYPYNLTPDPMYRFLTFAQPDNCHWYDFISIAPLGWGYIPDRFEWDASLDTATPVTLGVVQGTRWFHYADDMDIVSFDAEGDQLYYLMTGNLGSHITPFLALLPPGSSTPIATGENVIEWICPRDDAGNYKLVIAQSDTGLYVQQYGGFTYYDLEVYHRTFFDVTAANWAFKPIERCVAAGIVNGYDDGSYQPAQPVTRDQMAVYISRALAGGDDKVPAATGAPSFTDVGADSWAFNYVEYAKSMGVVQGYAGDYRPTDNVDRAQMAAFIARAKAGGDSGATTTRVSPQFRDVPPSHWAFRYVEYLASNKLATGFADRTFRPTSICTRDAMAAFISSAFAPVDSDVRF